MRSGEFAAARLERMHETLAGHVEGGQVPGLVTLVSRHGEVHADVIGETGFDAAAMILVEACVLRLDDPVDALLPELADRRVLPAIDAPLETAVPANRQITVRDVMTFRHGYGAIFAPPG